MSEPDLTFDPEKHLYRLKGVRIPSVTQILEICGCIDKTWYTQEACTRGQYVAKATALLDLGQLDWSTVDDRLMPYLQSWRKFIEGSGIVFEPQDIEREVCNPVFGYAGRFDRLGLWGGMTTLIDIKTGGQEPWHSLQLNLYAYTISPSPRSLVNVFLSEDGYKAVKHEHSTHALAFAAVANWRLNKEGDSLWQKILQQPS